MSDELADLRRAIETFPKAVTDKLRAVAFRTSRDVMARAKQNLRAQVHGRGKDNQRTVDSIVVIEEADKKQFLVTVENPENPMLGNWLEFGTRHMSARPFMRPAGDAVEATYVREMTAAAMQAADEAFK